MNFKRYVLFILMLTSSVLFANVIEFDNLLIIGYKSESPVFSSFSDDGMYYLEREEIKLFKYEFIGYKPVFCNDNYTLFLSNTDKKNVKKLEFITGKVTDIILPESVYRIIGNLNGDVLIYIQEGDDIGILKYFLVNKKQIIEGPKSYYEEFWVYQDKLIFSMPNENDTRVIGSLDLMGNKFNRIVSISTGNLLLVSPNGYLLTSQYIDSKEHLIIFNENGIQVNDITNDSQCPAALYEEYIVSLCKEGINGQKFIK